MLESEVRKVSKNHIEVSSHQHGFQPQQKKQNRFSKGDLEGAWNLLEAMEFGDYGEEGLPDLYSYIIVFRAVRHQPNDLDHAFAVFQKLSLS